MAYCRIRTQHSLTFNQAMRILGVKRNALFAKAPLHYPFSTKGNHNCWQQESMKCACNSCNA